MKILVVDDDEFARLLVGEHLNATGNHQVYFAKDATEALEKISEATQKFDFFLVDIQMPQVDGVALVEMIRGTPGYELAPIIMLTAMRGSSYVDRAFEAGATDYITKPFDNVDLGNRMQSARALTLSE